MQTDAWICGSENELEEFIIYDYVGAPWDVAAVDQTFVGNSGLDLCKRSVMLDVIKQHSFDIFKS